QGCIWSPSVRAGTPPSFCSDIRSMVSPFASPTADTPPRSRSPAPASPASPCGSGSTAPPGRRRSCCRCGRRWPLQRSIPAQSCLWAMPTAAETRYPPAG
ncbi:50S ribosomal protein L23, partial [Dysosmobacter welbionis]